MGSTLTPPSTIVPKSNSVATMAFDQAIRRVIDGKKITKLEWKDKRSYCLLADNLLQLHKAGEAPDKLHPWIINDGDLLGTDWIELEE